MEGKTWTVLQFVDDGSVEAVPSTWVQGEFCHWPSLPSDKLNLSIKRCDPLNTCWPRHRVKIFRNATFDNYITARAKAKIAEDTSDLNTEAENPDNKRKRVQKIISSSSDDSPENINLLPKPPKLKKGFVRKIEFPENDVTNQEGAGCSHQNDVEKEPVLPVLPTLQDIKEQKENIPEYINKSLKTIIQQGHILRGVVTDTLAEVKLLRTEIKAKYKEEPNGQTNFFSEINIPFPLNNDEDFGTFENMLQNEETFKKACHSLSRFGGNNIYEVVKRMMQVLLTNEISLKYSWLGRKGKRCFKNTNIARLILDSTERSNLGTQKEFEINIQLWLRRASDRKKIRDNQQNVTSVRLSLP